MEDGCVRLSELQEKVNGADASLIDRVMMRKVRKISGSAEQILAFFQDGRDTERVSSLVSWFMAYFANSAIGDQSNDQWLDVASDVEMEGRLRSLHEGYGFIDGQKGSLFFPYSEWLDSVMPVDVEPGAIVCFRLGKNSRGPMAIKVHRKERGVSPQGWVLKIRGKLSADHSTYGFITGEDGNTYFLSYSDFLDPNITKGKLDGVELEFDVSPEKKGRYPAAKFVSIL